MATRIRLQRHGKKGRPYYKIVVADARAPRDGRYIDLLGSYNPTTIPASIDLNVDKSLDWVLKGAEPSDTVRAILKYRGVYYKKHLNRGVEKGALTEEQAEEKFQSWLNTRESKIADAQDAAQKVRMAKVKASVEAGKEKAEAKIQGGNETEESSEVAVEETPVAEASTDEVSVDTAPEAEAETSAPEAAVEENTESTTETEAEKA